MFTNFLKPPKIFLLDATGAMISTFSLLIPYSFEEFFGMPTPVVRYFIFIAILCCIFSTTIYLLNVNKWKVYLKIITLINICYCIFTGYHLLDNLNTITVYGYIYFIVEIIIILTLANIEWRVSSKK